MNTNDCDICGDVETSADGLHLCPDCEVLEDLVGGDVALLASFGGRA